MKTTINKWKLFKEGFIDDFVYESEYSFPVTILGILLGIFSVIGTIYGLVNILDTFNFLTILGIFISGIVSFIVTIVIIKVIIAVIAGVKNIKK